MKSILLVTALFSFTFGCKKNSNEFSKSSAAAGYLVKYGGLAASFGPGAVVAVGVAGAVHGALTGTAGAVLWNTFWEWTGL